LGGLLPRVAAVIAMFLALLGLFAALLFAVRARDVIRAAEDEKRRRAELEEQREAARRGRFDRLVFETVYEAAHNLRHLRLCEHGERYVAAQGVVSGRWPEFQTLQDRALSVDDFEDLFEQTFPDGRLWSEIDHMLRNDGFLGLTT
jgi:hypothetical protein